MRLRSAVFLWVVALVLGAAPAVHAEAKHTTITVANAFVRAVPEGQQNSTAYMTLTNNSSTPEKLVGATSPLAERLELHKIMNDHGLRRMHEIDEIVLPPHGTVELKFGTFHLMLIGLKQPLIAGKMVPIDLRFGSSGHIRLKAPIVDIKKVKK